MRHRINRQSFGRKAGPKKALVRGLVYSLVEHGRIRTTLAKAKYIRPIVEKAITLSQRENRIHARRTLLSMYPHPETVSRLMEDFSFRFKDRAGGYTRIIKLGPRPGDQADMAYIEFVDYVLPGAELKDMAILEAKYLKNMVAGRRRIHKKSVRKIKEKSRRINRVL